MNFQFSDSTYKFLKWIAVIVLPALATFYAGLGALWGWGNITPVVGTITFTDTLLGSLIQLSTINYNKSVSDPAVIGATGTEVEKAIDVVVDLAQDTKNTPYDADAPPSHRKED